jgi:predicted Fe-Mo cluster-binding NifX family protein
MRIAVATDDGTTVARHFGRASHYLVVTFEDGAAAATELRPKAGHHTFAGEHHGPGRHEESEHGHGPEADVKHRAMAAPVADCESVIAGGMGRGAFLGLRSFGLEAWITDVSDALEAATRCASGTLPNLIDRLH